MKIIEQLLKPRTIFTFMFFGSMCFMLLKQCKVPQELNTIVSMLLGYYFGERKANGNGNNKKEK